MSPGVCRDHSAQAAVLEPEAQRASEMSVTPKGQQLNKKHVAIQNAPKLYFFWPSSNSKLTMRLEAPLHLPVFVNLRGQPPKQSLPKPISPLLLSHFFERRKQRACHQEEAGDNSSVILRDRECSGKGL